MRLLVVEWVHRGRGRLATCLRAAGHVVDTVVGDDGDWLAADVPYDAIVTRSALATSDQAAFCRRIRARGVWTPILVLTGAGDRAGLVEALDAGADEGLAGPVGMDELLAQLRALVRRGQPERPVVLQVGSVRLDPASRQVTARGRLLPINGHAFDILELLMRRAGQIVSRGEIADHAWDWAWQPGSNVIDVHVSAARHALRAVPGAPVIEAVRGVGYVLRPPASAGSLPAAGRQASREASSRLHLRRLPSVVATSP